jgi:plastocyanin domain-containing protein
VPSTGTTQRVAITAKAGRFEPAQVHLVQGAPAVLEFTRIVESTCMNAVRMPWMEEAVELPMNEKVEIAVDTSMTGVFTYACWMDMVFGEVMIHEN